MRFKAFIIAVMVTVMALVATPAMADKRLFVPDTDKPLTGLSNLKYSGPQFSSLSFVCDNKLYTSVFSALTVADVKNLYNDVVVAIHYGITDMEVFINSPGGDAFSGLALADMIERARKMGMKVTGYACGIVASAAVPVYAVCTVRKAAPGTIFMVHETSIWKWPGRETASDIRSQNSLMELLRNRYISKLVANSSLTKEDWEELEHKTTWFDAEKAKSFGLIDIIE